MRSHTQSKWEKCRISDIATVVRGSSPRPAGDPRYFSGSYLPWATVADVVNASGLYLTKTASMLTQEGARFTRILEPDTFLLTNSGARTLGVPKITRIRTGANDGIAALLNLSSRIVPEFLCYQLEMMTGHFRNKVASGNDQLNLNTDLIGATQIVVPTIWEQRAIAEIGTTWDRAITTTEALIQTKTRYHRALMHQLLSGKRRFRGSDGKPWQNHRLGDLFIERDEPGREDLRLLSITADRGIIPREDVDRKDTSSENKKLYKRICVGDIGYNTMRMWQGVSAVSRYEGIVSPAYTICTPQPGIDPEFAGYLFKYPPIIHLFYRYSQGLVDDTLNLKFHHFSQIHATIPGVEVQRQIVRILQAVDREIYLLYKNLNAYKLQKHGLMRMLLTEQVRVKSQGEVA